jgi:universal stress protein F
MFKKILLALDLGDPNSIDRILPVAEEMAARNNAELHVLTVIPSYSMPIVGSFFPDNFEQNAVRTAQEKLTEILSSRAANPAGTKGHVAHGAIYEEIIKSADALGCDLIIMEAHRPELKDFLLGPNAARVVRHARQSIFVVRS